MLQIKTVWLSLLSREAAWWFRSGLNEWKHPGGDVKDQRQIHTSKNGSFCSVYLVVIKLRGRGHTSQTHTRQIHVINAKLLSTVRNITGKGAAIVESTR